VPVSGLLRPADEEILATVETGFKVVGEHLNNVHLRAALAEAMRLASEVNKYLDQIAPWFEIKTDKKAAATTVYTALKAIDSLKILFAPFIPFSSERLHRFLGYEGPLFGTQSVEVQTDRLGEHEVLRYHPEQAQGRWEASQLEAGRPLVNPEPLFRKLDESVAEEERTRLGT
jgi:methionyl-tRNA synthetase